MFKRIISASLSLTMLISAAAADGFNSLIADNSSNKSHSESDKNSTAQLKGQNSFGKYIENTSSKDKKEIKPLGLKSDSAGFKVSRIAFDPESGKLTVISTQSTSCTLKVEFIDDDYYQNVYELNSHVKPGEQVETIVSVDKGKLPEFYKIKAVLTDVNGNTLGEPFFFNGFMRFMQELDKATVEDFNSDFVVNLDNDDTTNFFVLNENTIIADSSEEVNTLVSADYDDELYVFENINDSIRYLSEGDYFFVQPDEKNIVAVNVGSISINGDTATIKGRGELDDIFEVIKIEVGSNEIDASEIEKNVDSEKILINGVSAEENDDYSVEYNGIVVDDEGEQSLQYSVLDYSDTNTPRAFGKWVDLGNLDSQKSITIPLEWNLAPYKLDEDGNVVLDDKGNKKQKKYEIKRDKGKDWDNNDKDHDYVDSNMNSFDFNVQADIAATLGVKVEANITVFKYKEEHDYGIDGSIEAKLEAKGKAKLEVAFATPKMTIFVLPALSLDVKAEVKVGVEASVTVSAAWKYKFSAHNARDAYGNDISKSDSDFDKGLNNNTNKFEVKGKFYITVTPSLSLTFALVVSVGIEFPIKFEIGVTFYSLSNSSYDLEDVTIKHGKASWLAPGGASASEPVHSCDACFLIEPSLTIKMAISFEVPLFKKFSIELGERKWSFTPWHWSPTYDEFTVGECQHYLYPTDIVIKGNEDISASGLTVEVDEASGNTGNGDTVRFCLDPDMSHSYRILSNGKEIKNGSFDISREYSTISIEIDGGIAKEESAPVTTTTVYTEPTEPHEVSSVIQEIKNNNPGHIMVEYGKLGDNVTYSLYSNGWLYIFGYGPMNYDDDPIQNKELVRNVYMEDYATYMRKQLESEAGKETLIDEYTSRNQDELCDKYLGSHRNDIVNTLHTKYNVSKDDSDLDEMIDDYIYANSEDIAREYYNENSDEYAAALAELKMILLEESAKKVFTSVGNKVFDGCVNLESVTYADSPNEGKIAFDLPKTIKSIGEYAFNNCNKLSFGDLVFGNNLEYIGEGAFQSCSGITCVRVPVNVRTIDAVAFRYCENLETAAIESDTHELGIGMFYGCGKLRDLTLPESVIIKSELIGESYRLNNLFHNNYGQPWNDIDVPKSLKKVTLLRGDTIHDNAFNGLSSVETIIIPEGVKNVGDGAFSWLGELVNINCLEAQTQLSFSEVFKDVETIGKSAFSPCEKLQIGELVFGENTKSIGAGAFYENKSITGLYIPESVEYVGSGAFQLCQSLTKAVIHAGAEEYDGIFYGDSSLEELELPFFITVRGGRSLAQLFNNNEGVIFNDTEVPQSLKKVTVLSGEEIPDNAFNGLRWLEKIVIPVGIRSVGEGAFCWLGELTSIDCVGKEDLLSFSDVFKNVESIGKNAFSTCEKLEIGNLEFGDGLKSIGVSAFYDNPTITSVYIPESAEFIGKDAFKNCHGIKKAVVMADVESIEGGIFYDAGYRYSEFEELVISSCFMVRNMYRLSQLFNDNENGSFNDTDIPPSLRKITIINCKEMPENYLDGFYRITVLELPSEITFVGKHATQDLGELEEVIYGGTDEDWEKIDIREENDPLLRTKITVSAEEEPVWGDANNDGTVDMSDVVMIMQAICNPNKFGINGTDPNHITEAGWKFADADDDGLTLGDAFRIQQYLLGIIPSLV